MYLIISIEKLTYEFKSIKLTFNGQLKGGEVHCFGACGE